MSQYIAVGITDEDLNAKGSCFSKDGFPVPCPSGGGGACFSSDGFPIPCPTSGSSGNPLNSLFDFMESLKLKAEIALTDPRVKQFMQEAGIKAEQVRAEDVRRKRNNKNLLLWGGGAAVVAFLILRKKR